MGNSTQFRLTDAALVEMRTDISAGQLSATEIARKYGISDSTVRYYLRKMCGERPAQQPSDPRAVLVAAIEACDRQLAGYEAVKAKRDALQAALSSYDNAMEASAHDF